MNTRIYTNCVCLIAALLPLLPITAEDSFKPERIYAGTKFQTKTYMHQFVENPSGTKYAFRYFPGKKQPQGAKGPNRIGNPCEIWICNSDLSGHHRAFTSPNNGESGHGDGVIVWVTDDLIYYCGVAYQLSTGKVLWQFDNRSPYLIPHAQSFPVSPKKLYVRVQGGFQGKGIYWLDPSSSTKPELHLVTDMKNLPEYYKGKWEQANTSYVYQNPSDTKLFMVVLDGEKRKEHAFIINVNDGSVHSYLGRNGVGRCNNGHVLWYDDQTLMAGNEHAGLFDLKGKLIRRLSPQRQGGHISLSPDKKWWVGDMTPENAVRLYRFGSMESVVISGDAKYDNCHPSFSRDGRYVFFQGKKPFEPHVGVYRVDVSGIVGRGESPPSKK